MRGLVFGKFYPFHRGHEYLIRNAAENCSELIVLVCASDREKFSVEARVDWIRATFPNRPDIRVIPYCYCEDRLANTSVACRTISKQWAEVFKDLLPPIDILWSGEDYGDFVAEYLGCRHQRISRWKNISATAVRNNLPKRWRWLNRHVRQTFRLKVAILGTESSGKSTLARDLCAAVDGELVEEAGRAIVPRSDECREEDLNRILIAHAELIRKKMRTSKSVVVMDTDMHITRSYARFLYQKDLLIPREVRALNRADIYIYLDNDAPYVQDGTRFSRADRNRLDQSHKSLLNELDVPYVLLRGSYRDKLENSIKLIGEYRRSIWS